MGDNPQRWTASSFWILLQLAFVVCASAQPFVQGAMAGLPGISNIPDQQILPNVSSSPIPFVVTAFGTSLESLTLTASASNSVLIPSSGFALGGAGSNRTLTITPAPNQRGNTIVTVVVTDTNGASASDTFMVAVGDRFTQMWVSPEYERGAWGDYNNDGYVDLALVGTPSRILRNNGDGTFTNSGVVLPNLNWGAAAWGDYDRDGDLDLALTGWTTNGVVTAVYRNNADGTFADIQTVLPVAWLGAIAWGDLDNDGDLDFVIGGATEIGRNNGNGTFTAVQTGLPVLEFSTVACGDYDRDGLLDILLTGSPDLTRVYRNQGNSKFIDIGAALPDVSFGDATWGDFDNDGFLDIGVTEMQDGTQTDRLTRIDRNNGDGRFTEAQTGLGGSYSSGLAWGDYDNNGWSDLVVAGPSTLIYRNNGDRTLSDSLLVLRSRHYVAANWADCDNDGDLDLLVTTRELAAEWAHLVWLYRNDASVHNTPPAAPAGLATEIALNNEVRFSWLPATDAETTNAAGLNYNFRVGRTPGGIDVVSPQADLVTGRRRVVAMGNASAACFALLRDLPPGTYYWSVQTIDPAFAGSPFSAEATFAITNARPTISAIDDLAASQLQPTPILAFTVGDLETPASNLVVTAHSSDTDRLPVENILLGGADSNRTVQVFPVLHHIGPVTITLTVTDEHQRFWTESFGLSVTNAPPFISTLTNRAIAMDATSAPIPFTVSDAETAPDALEVSVVSDATNLVPAGSFQFGGSGSNRTLFITPTPGAQGSSRVAVSVSDGDGGSASNTFTLTVTNPLPFISFIADQDFLPGEPIPPINFTVGDANTPASSLVVTAYSSVMPSSNLVVTGSGSNRTLTITPVAGQRGMAVIGVRVTDGQQSARDSLFVLTVEDAAVAPDALPDLRYGSFAWGDYDDDGWLDILLTGRDVSTAIISRVYRNNGDGTFSRRRIPLAAVSLGNGVWADLDNDGFLDIVVSGFGRERSLTVLYRNGGDGTFAEIQSGVPGNYGGFVAWGDYDNDGDLDLVLAGSVCCPYGGMTQVYRNNGGGTFTATAANFTILMAGSPGDAAWADYDDDGDLDLLLTGQGEYQRGVAKLYQNNGNGGFTEAATGLRTQGGSAAWGDYSGDGLIDIGFGDWNYEAPVQVWRNTGAGRFANTDLPISSGYIRSTTWGDFDNDGRPDLLLAGAYTSVLGRVLRNNGDQTFTDFGVALPGIMYGKAAWGDYDSDGDLDIGLARVFTNPAAVSNTPPTAPASVSATVLREGKVILRWARSTDAETPSTGLNYNLRVGTAPGGQDVMTPQADLATGWRRVPALGNAGTTNFWWLRLRPGTYYWSVQAIDAAYAGSPFAAEATFTVPPTLSLRHDVSGSWVLTLIGEPNHRYRLEVSEDLRSWSELAARQTSVEGMLQFTDDAVGLSQRFYRAQAVE